MLRVAKLTDAAGARAADPRAQRLRRRADGRGRPSGAMSAMWSRSSCRRRRSRRPWSGSAKVPPGSSSTRISILASSWPAASRATAFAARPPRLEVNCKANVKVATSYYTVDVHDISLGGMKVEPIEEYCLGKKVVVVVESLRPIRGEVRWFADRKAGHRVRPAAEVRGTGRMDRQAARNGDAQGQHQGLSPSADIMTAVPISFVG